MNNLVTTDGIEIFATTLVIAAGVGNDHESVMNLLKRHAETEILNGFEIGKVKTKGRPQEFANLTELQATFLITLMKNSEKVIEFKQKLTKEFFNQRRTIAKMIEQQANPNWRDMREDGKAPYMQKTEVIKVFVDYAIEQGSSAASRYYANFAKMENKSLFECHQKFKNMREVLSIRQLFQVATADQIIEKALVDGMKEELHYKEIYKLAKGRVIQYAELIGRSPILQLTQQEDKS